MEPLYTIKEVADYLKVSKSTAERFIRDKQLDAVMLGSVRHRRVTETQLKEFLRRRTPVVKRPKFE